MSRIILCSTCHTPHDETRACPRCATRYRCAFQFAQLLAQCQKRFAAVARALRLAAVRA